MAEFPFRATVALTPRSAGGIRDALPRDYRPALWFGETGPRGEPHLHSSLMRVRGMQRTTRGSPAEVDLKPLAFETWPRVRKGTKFQVFEGLRAVGTGEVTATEPEARLAKDRDLAFHEGFEHWAMTQFGSKMARIPAQTPATSHPDLIAWFEDDERRQHSLVVDVVARRPRKQDIYRLLRVMDQWNALLGVLVVRDEAPAAVWDAIVQSGSVALGRREHVPRIRLVTARELLDPDTKLVPGAHEADRVEMVAAA